jgi:hypothetical protein
MDNSVNDNNIIFDIESNDQMILPIPYTEGPVPSVAKPNTYGKSPYPVAEKPIPITRKKDQIQYCNTLDPAPRDQRLNVPYEGDKNCPDYPQPYSRDSCYLMDSKTQGVVGVVCNTSGGSDNANFRRGNTFGLDYNNNFQKELNDKQLEYIVNQPVQSKMIKENPSIVMDTNTFYPQPSFPLRGTKDFLTYPLQQNYTRDGMPTYVYPYKTMNSVLDNGVLNNSVLNNSVLEDFEDYSENNMKKNHALFIIILIIVFILFIFMR